MANDTCLCIDLRAAANKLTRMYDEIMAPSGISVTQFSLLHQIHRLDAPTLKELAEASDLERSTLGRNVRVLERQGLVSMKVGGDARTRTLHLTRNGVNVFKRAVPLWYSVQTQLIDRLGPAGRGQLNDLLDTLTAPAAAN